MSAMAWFLACSALIIGGMIGSLIQLSTDGRPLLGGCRDAGCKGGNSRLCFDGLCVRHCREMHKETCGGTR